MSCKVNIPDTIQSLNRVTSRKLNPAAIAPAHFGKQAEEDECRRRERPRKTGNKYCKLNNLCRPWMRQAGPFLLFILATLCEANPSVRRPLCPVIIGILLCLPFTSACYERTILRENGVSEYEKQIILDVHNRMRQAVALGQIGGQPPAANMIEMKWDDELSAKAQKWALKCSSQRHDNYRHTDRFLVGQNTATTWTTKSPVDLYELESDFPSAIQKWFDEVRKFRFGKQPHPGAGHYAQMIWANTYLVGCGYNFYHTPQRGFTKYYVCNYGPSGNVDGESPYRKGYPSCFEYGLENSRKYAGLCDKAEVSHTNHIFTFHDLIG